jgi:very-short-patch-repair endonuclease
MTPMERRTIEYIERAIPGVRVHAQVSMGALLEPRRSLFGQDRRRVFFSFAAKRIDFVLEDRRSGKIMALIELDDFTHDAAADRHRDRLTAAAGYLTIRLPAHDRPTRQNVAERIHAALVRDPRSEDSQFG